MSGIYFGSLEDQVNDIFSLSKEPVRDITKELVKEAVEDTVKGTVKDVVPPLKQQQKKLHQRDLRIPTGDADVRSGLKALNQPITLFGEGPAERRDRLREMAFKALNGFKEPLKLFPILAQYVGETSAADDLSDDDDEEFYVPGPVELVELRKELLECSLKAPIAGINRLAESLKRQELYSKLKSFDLTASFMDVSLGSRPFSVCSLLNNDDNGIIVGDFGGRLMKYSGSGEGTLLAHLDGRVSALAREDSILASGTITGKISITDHNNNTMLTGHSGRIGKLAWNPQRSGLLASTSFDSTWRLWDLQKGGQEMQLQEGHVGGVLAGAWHHNGALFATGGAADGVVRVWDCRVGRAIWTLQSPNRGGIVDLSFSPLTSALAVAGDDGRVWVNDLRAVKQGVLGIPAHVSACTVMRYAAGGRVLMSAGLDGAVRVWGVGDGRLVGEMLGGAKVMDFDVMEQGETDRFTVALVGYDRSVKLYRNNKA